MSEPEHTFVTFYDGDGADIDFRVLARATVDGHDYLCLCDPHDRTATIHNGKIYRVNNGVAEEEVFHIGNDVTEIDGVELAILRDYMERFPTRSRHTPHSF